VVWAGKIRGRGLGGLSVINNKGVGSNLYTNRRLCWPQSPNDSNTLTPIIIITLVQSQYQLLNRALSVFEKYN